MMTMMMMIRIEMKDLTPNEMNTMTLTGARIRNVLNHPIRVTSPTASKNMKNEIMAGMLHGALGTLILITSIYYLMM